MGREALAYLYGNRHASGVPVPVAREKALPGREASREIVSGFAQQAYEDLAYPHKTVATAQLEGALQAMRRHGRGEDRRSPRWEEVGPFTLDVAREATQNSGLTTQWSGRLTAMVADPKCDSHDCRLYLGAAGGGVWRTDDALDRNPRWKALDKGLDTTSIGALLIDPTDKSGRTIYVGTGEPSGSGDSEAGLGLYKSTDRGEHWKLVPGSYAVAKDRGIGEIAVDPKNPRHIWIGTTVARHAGSGVSGGRFTPPGAPTIGLYESTNGGASFQLRFNLPQDPVNPNSPNGSDFFKGGVTDIEYDPVDKSTLYFTMFDYGVFRLTRRGRAAEHLHGRRALTRPGLGIRYEVAAAKLSNGRTRLYVHDGRNEVDADHDGGFDRRWLARPAHRRRTGGDARVPDAVEPDVDGTPGLQLVRHLRRAVLVRHADRRVSEEPGRRDDRRSDAVRRAPALPRRGPVERPQHHALAERGRATSRTCPARPRIRSRPTTRTCRSSPSIRRTRTSCSSGATAESSGRAAAT